MVELYSRVARRCLILPHMLRSWMCLELAYMLKRGAKVPFFSLTSSHFTSSELMKFSISWQLFAGIPSFIAWVIACISIRVVASHQTLLTMSWTLSVVRVESPAIENRKSEQLGMRGTTLNVISEEDQTGRSRRVQRWSSNRLYMRNVDGGWPDSLAFVFGPGLETDTCWPCVISAAALKICVWMLSCRDMSVTSFPKGMAASLPSGRLSHVSITLRSIRSKMAVGWALLTLGIGALVYLSRGFAGVFLVVMARFARSLLVVTIARRVAWGVTWLGVSSPVCGAGVLGSVQRSLGGSSVVWGDGEGGSMGLSSLGKGGNGRVGRVVCALGWCCAGVSGGISWPSRHVASAGTEIVVILAILGIGSYMDSMSVLSP